jgi:hypothetical protein
LHRHGLLCHATPPLNPRSGLLRIGAQAAASRRNLEILAKAWAKV